MPDRVVGEAALVYADIPGASGTVTVSVTDPAGEAILTSSPATLYGSRRYAVTIDAAQVRRGGTWLAVFADDNGERLRLPFTVGARPVAGLDRFRLRAMLASRLRPEHVGTITSADVDYLADASLLGSADQFSGKWVVLGMDAGLANAGEARLVKTYNGDVLSLAAPLPEAPPAGASYALVSIPPRELDSALQAAIAELSELGRVPVVAPDIALVDEGNGVLTCPVPRGFAWVYDVWGPRGRIPHDEWAPVAGRKIKFGDALDLEAGELVTIYGVRPLAPLAFEDSLLDVEPTAILAQASASLHAARASGPAIDVEEHLRRYMVAMQTVDSSIRRLTGRMPAGARRVVE